MEMNYDNKVLHQIEEEINVEILPGTEIMADIGSHHFVKSKDNSRRVLVPQPSNDPHDPLNWSMFWKIATVTSANFVSFSQGFGPLSLAPMFTYYIEDFNCSLADAVQFTGVCILVLGFSNFLWVPISSSFGRRPVYIFSQIICLISNIWRAKASSYNSFMGACILNGIGAGPAETIQLAVHADIFFLHARGKWNTMFWVVYMGSMLIGPVIAGSMADHVGWRSFFWLNVALLALSLIMVIFLFPETRWHRVHPDEIKQNSASTSQEKVGESATIEKTSSGIISADPPSPTPAETESGGAEPSDPWLGRGSPSKAQWRIFQPNAHPFKSIFMEFWIPWKLFAFPIAEFSAFVISWSCSSFLTINLTQAQAFGPGTYYNFSSQNVGFMNFALLVGTFIGLATAGPLSDWVSARATRKNGGIREPEMRLPAMVPYVLIMMLGNIITSVGYQNHWPWEAIVVIGFTCAGIQLAALPSIVSTYAIDSYKPVAGSLLVTATVNKNLWGYGFSKFITNWAAKDGFIPPIMTNMSLITLWCSFGILFYFKGKTFRRWSKNSSVHRL